MTILDSIAQRHSMRSFDGSGVPEEIGAELLRLAENSPSPFGRTATIRLKKFTPDGDFRPGTYGTIRGAKDFFVIAYSDDDLSALDAGFRFEQVVLEAWRHGLGSCWIGGTFRQSCFGVDNPWPKGQSLKAICPVGHPAGESWRGKLTKFIFGSRNRKAFDSLFLSAGSLAPLPADCIFHEALEMARLAPSSMNSQPWRALVDGSAVHFFCKPSSSLSALDTGIAICHFWLTEDSRSHKGSFSFLPAPPPAPGGWKYLATYTREG